MTDETRRILAGAIGRPLRKVIASAHLFERKLDGEPIHLWLSFEDLALFRLFGASDGWHLGVDRILPEPTDMGESGEIILVDVSNKTTFGQMIGKELEGAWLAESPAGEIVGVRFDFGFSLRPIVINWGDELRIVDDYPPDARGEEIIEARIQPVALR
jgi:hypothetical protein